MIKVHGEALQTPCNLETFHESELIEFQEEALGLSFYSAWRNAGGGIPKYDQCVGYKVPLFLGGIDGVDNLELSDIDVYWSLTGQILSQIERS